MNFSKIRFRLKWFGRHLGVSLVVVAAVYAAVLFIWYPGAFAALQGVSRILLIVAAVDLVLGPFCTFLVASPSKQAAGIVRDVAIIGVVQIAALVIGMSAVYSGRVAYVVFDGDRFIAVQAYELTDVELARARSELYSKVPLGRPVWVLARLPGDLTERFKFIQDALARGGYPSLPELYEPWPPPANQRPTMMRDWSQLPAGDLQAKANEVLLKSGVAEKDAGFFVLEGREGSGIAIVRRDDLTVLGVVTAMAML